MNKLTIAILAGLSMVGPLAIDTYLPSFPAIGATFNVSALLVQQTLSLYLLAFALMTLFYGTMSDSFGRRPVLIAALIIYVIASLGAAFAPSFGWLLAFRVLQGAVAGAGSVIGQAIVRDRLSGAAAQRALSYILTVFGLAPAIAPILGGWLQVTFGWRAIFIFLAAFGVLMIATCYRALPESLPLSARHPFQIKLIAGHYGRVLRHRQFLLLSFATAMAFGGFALYVGSAANFVMVILKLPETAFGWMFIPLISGLMLGSTLSARYATRIAPHRLIALGYAAMASAAFGNVLYTYFCVAAIPWAVLPLMLYALGASLATPAMAVIAQDFFPHNRGLAAAMQLFVRMLSFAAVTGAIAPLLFGSALKLASGVLVGFVVSFTCWILGRPRRVAMTPGIA
jgi:DHA1 family bicyclomycin/chloramphenicol resistance-like MFS transporter